MKIQTTWQGKMQFEASDGERHTPMDAPPPFGNGEALSPKQLLLAAVCGCTGIDVAARMRKHKQNLTALRIEAEAPKREGKPATFDSITLDFFFEGVVQATVAIEAVEASQSEECGVSAMVARHCEIFFHVHLNGDKIHSGKAKFKA